MNLLETKNLTKQYGKHVVVNQLNLTIAAGKLTAYLGTNGAGKSTTIQMLTHTLTPSSGEICSSNSLAMGVVFQNSVLDTELTVWDNLVLRGALYKDVTKEHLIALMQRTGISAFSQQKYGQLSGGMRRKVDITRALINQPTILFLDEPTTGLDPNARKELWGLLNQLKQNGVAIFLTTHYLEEAESADYIYILEKGTILEEGTAHSLKEKYQQPSIRLLSHQISVLEKHLKNYSIIHQTAESIDVALASKDDAIALLITVQGMISDFSYQPIGMTDVFLKVTGRSIEG